MEKLMKSKNQNLIELKMRKKMQEKGKCIKILI